ncbi:GNAT family N-acetyltransferase [Virgibacillus indicus]|uniref:GNAT family N-acetyltransferase n=1 Tax=Virgibacillus indicus TaxID=2024554 RepID=A0A265N518_9BACI|nr:GNAT family protein [Virgibacillus indicus]OZU87138.1 GNAT family N-acetyltransferase [Virgibacillus indicus]
MRLYVKNMTEKFAAEILSWKYTKPYDFYNSELTSEALSEMLEESYFALVDSDDELVGFFCIGESAQVPAGNPFGAYNKGCVDIGIGMKPVLTGKGCGYEFLTFILSYVQQNFPDQAIRLTVATFNKRAIHIYEKVGFTKEKAFHTEAAEFITMVKQVN